MTHNLLKPPHDEQRTEHEDPLFTALGPQDAATTRRYWDHAIEPVEREERYGNQCEQRICTLPRGHTEQHSGAYRDQPPHRQSRRKAPL